MMSQEIKQNTTGLIPKRLIQDLLHKLLSTLHMYHIVKEEKKVPGYLPQVQGDIQGEPGGPPLLPQCPNLSAVMPSQLESAMESLIMVFHRYSDKDGKRNTLSKKELKQLMETELASFLKSQKDPATIDKIMKDLDQNGDGEVSFEEFVSLVVGLSIACEEIYQLQSKTPSKK
uniref:S100 calcium binding protein A10b n=1 Tax=Esox lucius TaxID=8010 RepID=A0AAY5K942_ESOLU